MSVIYVGANTDVEQKELYDRVDDAVCAVRSALEEGVLPGGGVALKYIAETMELPSNVLQESLDVFKKAIMAPLRQIVANSGRDVAEIDKNIANCGPNFGFDVKVGKYGNMMAMGVIDPAKVTKNALVSATSVAVTLLGTNAIITNESSK